jgi:site-specific recombinase XerD
VSLVGTGWVQRVPRDRLVLGITDNGTAHVHDLRHTYASSARRAGADLRLLQKMMGRASITATVHSYADELVRAPKLPAELQ